MAYPHKIVHRDRTSISLSFNCPFCQREQRLTVPVEGYEKYMNGAYVQDAFPELKADDRELFISGVCTKCFPIDEDE